VTKRIVGDITNVGVDGVAGVVVVGAVVLGVDVLGAVSISSAASGLAGAPVEGVAVVGAADSTSVVTLELAAGEVTLVANSD